MLSVEKLDVAYGGSQVLWGVDLNVPDGQVVCLMGRNGVGKTTVLRAIMGLMPARAGRIVLDGQDITRLVVRPAGARGARLRAAGARDLPAPERGGEPPDGAARLRARHVHRRRARPLPRAQALPVPQGRRPVGRRAADAGHRPRAAHAPEAPDPRRADRRNPALDHPRDRGRASAASRRSAVSPCSWSNSTWTSPSVSPTAT